MPRSAFRPLPALLCCLGLGLRADDAALRADLLRLLKPKYPDATFRATANGRVACRVETRLFRDPDRLGPGPGGIAVEYAPTFHRWSGPTALPDASTRELRGFWEGQWTLPSGDGEGYLSIWIRTPTLDPPIELQAALVQCFRNHVATWKPGSAPKGLFDFFPGGTLDAPGPPSRGDLVPSPTSPSPTHFNLEEIADSGHVFLHSDGTCCVNIWFSPMEGVGFGDAAIYRKEAKGWRIERHASDILRPQARLEGDRLIVTGGRLKTIGAPLQGGSDMAFSLPWPHPARTEEGALRKALQGLLGAQDSRAALREAPSGWVVGRVHPQVDLDPEGGGANEPVPSRVAPGPGGLTVAYRLIEGTGAAEPQRLETERQGLREVRLTLPSEDGKGILVATLTTPSVDPPRESQEAVILALKAFAHTWSPGLRGAHFAIPEQAWSYPVELERQEDLAVEAPLFLHPAGQLFLVAAKPGGAALYQRVRKGWRLRRTFPKANDFDLEGGSLRILAGGDVLQVIPWKQSPGDAARGTR